MKRREIAKELRGDRAAGRPAPPEGLLRRIQEEIPEDLFPRRTADAEEAAEELGQAPSGGRSPAWRWTLAAASLVAVLFAGLMAIRVRQLQETEAPPAAERVAAAADSEVAPPRSPEEEEAGVPSEPSLGKAEEGAPARPPRQRRPVAELRQESDDRAAEVAAAVDSQPSAARRDEAASRRSEAQALEESFEAGREGRRQMEAPAAAESAGRVEAKSKRLEPARSAPAAPPRVASPPLEEALLDVAPAGPLPLDLEPLDWREEGLFLRGRTAAGVRIEVRSLDRPARQPWSGQADDEGLFELRLDATEPGERLEIRARDASDRETRLERAVPDTP